MKNLLTDTCHEMRIRGLKPEDVTFIGSQDTGHSCTWEEFKVLANKSYKDAHEVEDDVYFQAVAIDLIIVFQSGAQFIREYDEDRMEEYWVYRRPFVAPADRLPIRNLFARKEDFYPSLEDLHED